MRASVVKELVGYDPAFPHAADLLLWLQAASISDIGRVNGVQAYYRTHPSQMHVTDYAGTLTDMHERTTLYRAFFTGDGRGARLPGAQRMLKSALRATAKEAVWCALLARIGDQEVGGSDSEAFRDFARSNCPTIERSLPWQELERRQRAEPPRIPDALTRFVYRAKWAIKWRIWRRWGM